MRIVHISDVHVQVHYDYRSLEGLWGMGWRRVLAQLELVTFHRREHYEDAPGLLAQIVRDVEAMKADHVVLSGDLTCLAMDEEFAGVRRALAPLSDDSRRLSVIPGNHDRYTRGSHRARRFERHFGHLLATDLPGYAGKDGYPYVRLLGEHLAVVGLDTTRVAPFPGVVFGHLGRRQLTLLEHVLDDPRLEGRAVLVLAHHAPLDPAGQPDTKTHGLLDGDALLAIVARHPRATLHHGHIHRRFRHPRAGSRPEIFGAGSSTAKGHGGYWVLDYDGPELLHAQTSEPGSPPAARG